MYTAAKIEPEMYGLRQLFSREGGRERKLTDRQATHSSAASNVTQVRQRRERMKDLMKRSAEDTPDHHTNVR